jgi:uncharacterized protein with HEPN domain
MSEKFINQHYDVPSIDIADFRNILVHEYFRVDVDIVWSVVERELIEVKEKIEILLLTLGQEM